MVTPESVARLAVVQGSLSPSADDWSVTKALDGAIIPLPAASPLDHPYNRVVKRVFDILVSLTLIALTLPIMIVTALLIKLESRGPALFSTLDDGSPLRRVGRDGLPFRYCKFRSMRPNSHGLRYTSLAGSNMRSGPLVKIKDDPRVTRIGAFIRRYSIDELPEFFLVLRGDMSMVGPRPHMPEEVARYAAWHRGVLAVKPGITGLAQVSGGSALGFDQEVRHDLAYIAGWSLWKDARIIANTPFAILRRRISC